MNCSEPEVELVVFEVVSEIPENKGIFLGILKNVTEDEH